MCLKRNEVCSKLYILQLQNLFYKFQFSQASGGLECKIARTPSQPPKGNRIRGILLSLITIELFKTFFSSGIFCLHRTLMLTDTATLTFFKSCAVGVSPKSGVQRNCFNQEKPWISLDLPECRNPRQMVKFRHPKRKSKLRNCPEREHLCMSQRCPISSFRTPLSNTCVQMDELMMVMIGK